VAGSLAAKMIAIPVVGAVVVPILQFVGAAGLGIAGKGLAAVSGGYIANRVGNAVSAFTSKANEDGSEMPKAKL